MRWLQNPLTSSPQDGGATPLSRVVGHDFCGYLKALHSQCFGKRGGVLTLQAQVLFPSTSFTFLTSNLQCFLTTWLIYIMCFLDSWTKGIIAAKHFQGFYFKLFTVPKGGDHFILEFKALNTYITVLKFQKYLAFPVNLKCS